MAWPLHKIWFIAGLFVLATGVARAQQGSSDTIRLGGIVSEDGDTLAMIFLPEITKKDRMPRRLARRMAHWNKLRHNVYMVYPYAVIAAEILKDVDKNLELIGDDKAARKKYLKSIEKQLNHRFKGELENLTISQGQVLVKLINRQTGKNCFSIIQELKGGFSAVVWQSVALLFSNNLKKEYDPADRDRDIEAIVQEIETRAYYQYRYRQQGK